MILGISHLALNTLDLDRASRRLEAFGFTQRFAELALENHVAKQPWMTRFHPTHRIASFVRVGSMPIEVIEYLELPGKPTPTFLPLFRCENPINDWTPVAPDGLPFDLSSLEGCSAFHDPELDATLLWKEHPGEQPEFHAIVSVCRLDFPSLDLLEELGLTRNDSDDMMVLRSPIPSLGARLLPVERRKSDDWADTGMLDSPGWPCLALVTRGMADRPLPMDERVKDASFNLTVNDKLLVIRLAEYDGGPFFEFVEASA